MTTSHITSSSNSSRYTEFRSYIPNSQPKPRSRAKIKTAGPNLSESDSREGGFWYDIDDFPMPDSYTSLPLDLESSDPFKDARPSEMADDLHAVHFLQEPEGYQRTPELLDEGEVDHAAPLSGIKVSTQASLPGTSLDCPLAIEEDNPADDCRSKSLGHDSSGYHTAIGLRECSSIQHGALDAADMEILFTEDTACTQNERIPEDKRFEDFGIANGPSTCKRARIASHDATTSAETVGLGSEPELDDSGLAKRRRECLISHLASPPESALSISSNEPGTSLLDRDIRGDTAGTSELHVADFLEGNGDSDGDSSVHHAEVGEPSLQLPSQPGSPLVTVEEPRIEPDSGRRLGTSNSDGEGVDAPGEASVGRVKLVSRKTSTVPSRQHRLSKHPLLTRGHNLSQNTSRILRRRTTPMNSLGRVSPSGSYQLPGMGAPRVTRPGCQQASVRTRAKDEPNTNQGPQVNPSYQIVDFALHAIPEGSSIVTAKVYCGESKPMPNLAAPSLGILGDGGQAIRTIQISSDSWLLLGYRCNDDTPGQATGESLVGLEQGQKSYPRVDSANDDSDHVDDSMSGSEEDEDEEGDVRPCKRTNTPWSELDDVQLKAYVKMGMEWMDIFEKFPKRTPGAVRTHWHTLQKKRQSTQVA